MLNITRRRGKSNTRYLSRFKNFGDIPVDGRITLKYVYGRRLYRREFNCLDLFFIGWNSGFRHKGFVSFRPTARRFSRNFSSNTTCITFFYRLSFHMLFCFICQITLYSQLNHLFRLEFYQLIAIKTEHSHLTTRNGVTAMCMS